MTKDELDEIDRLQWYISEVIKIIDELIELDAAEKAWEDIDN